MPLKSQKVQYQCALASGIGAKTRSLQINDMLGTWHMTYMTKLLLGLWVLCWGAAANAQDTSFVFTTVERPPFSMDDNGDHSGFSIELMRAIAQDQGWDIQFQRMGSFSEMMASVTDETADGAVANISITASREQEMDFAQPIFEAGLQIMVPYTAPTNNIFSTLFTWDIALAVLLAVGLLFGGGMLMWVFERHKQPYFDRPANEALFPSFWWALNLVVNGGFEERMPQSRFGRVFAVLLVVSSLFIVSIFVAKITAGLTVQAITSSVNSLSDLEGRVVATTEGSTASTFLTQRDIAHQKYDGLDTLLADFEDGKLDAVVFDGPILAFYSQNRGAGVGRLIPRMFRPEDYGVALPSGSPLIEPINRSLLLLREDGTYDQIRQKYFGGSN